jgi:hypothetical protein
MIIVMLLYIVRFLNRNVFRRRRRHKSICMTRCYDIILSR